MPQLSCMGWSRSAAWSCQCHNYPVWADHTAWSCQCHNYPVWVDHAAGSCQCHNYPVWVDHAAWCCQCHNYPVPWQTDEDRGAMHWSDVLVMWGGMTMKTFEGDISHYKTVSKGGIKHSWERERESTLVCDSANYFYEVKGATLGPRKQNSAGQGPINISVITETGERWEGRCAGVSRSAK